MYMDKLDCGEGFDYTRKLYYGYACDLQTSGLEIRIIAKAISDFFSLGTAR